MDDLTIAEARIEALHLAVGLWEDRQSSELVGDVLHTAGEFTAFLTARPARLTLTPSALTFEQGSPGPGTPTRFTGGNSMSVLMTDAQEVTYTAAADDAKGFPAADTLTWSADDGGAFLVVTPAADGLSCLFAAVAPGEATITVTDGVLAASDVITVTAGPAASLTVTPGAVEDQPAPAPAG